MENKSHHLLRVTRIVVAIVSISLLTGLFVDYGMTFPRIASWLAKVQFLPAAMAFSLGTFIVWLIVTLCFGRIYCSVACPLGIFQDICARIPRMGKFMNGKRAYHFLPERRKLRNISLFVVVVSIFLGISVVTSLIDPYSIYGRFCLDILRPLWGWCLNLYSSVAGNPPVKIAIASTLGIVVAFLSMAIIAVLAFRNGRTFCNTVCPVGTTLSYVSRYSVFRIDINTDKCIQCRKCEHVCKSSCIDLADHVVDMSRCVVCFDCLSVCPNDAIHYTYTRHQLSIPLMQRTRNPLAGSAAGMDSGRRAFLVTAALGAVAPLAAKVKDDAALLHAGAKSGRNVVPVTPPGIRSRRQFLERCTSCGLCIAQCPQKVLVQSVDEYGLLRALHPVMDYDASWCLYDCTVCANLCPSGALHPLTIEEKHTTPIGLAHVDKDLCISYAYGDHCGRCSRKCPAGAIAMHTSDGSGKGPYPVVDLSKCIGCGACQNVCPASPVKAIVVSGIV